MKLRLILSCLLSIPSLHAQVPGIINYQGRVVVNGTNFNGTGQFVFALINTDGSRTYWSNGVNAVSLTVTKGLYSVLLGDTNIPNMNSVIPAAVFTNANVLLRVWFNDGVIGFQQLSPDQRIAAVGYAMMAANVPAGAITSTQLASNSVTAANIATGAVGSVQLAVGAVGTTNIASGAVGAEQLASNAVTAIITSLTNGGFVSGTITNIFTSTGSQNIGFGDTGIGSGNTTITLNKGGGDTYWYWTTNNNGQAVVWGGFIGGSLLTFRSNPSGVNGWEIKPSIGSSSGTSPVSIIYGAGNGQNSGNMQEGLVFWNYQNSKYAAIQLGNPVFATAGSSFSWGGGNSMGQFVIIDNEGDSSLGGHRHEFGNSTNFVRLIIKGGFPGTGSGTNQSSSPGINSSLATNVSENVNWMAMGFDRLQGGGKFTVATNGMAIFAARSNGNASNNLTTGWVFDGGVTNEFGYGREHVIVGWGDRAGASSNTTYTANRDALNTSHAYHISTNNTLRITTTNDLTTAVAMSFVTNVITSVGGTFTMPGDRGFVSINVTLTPSLVNTAQAQLIEYNAGGTITNIIDDVSLGADLAASSYTLRGLVDAGYTILVRNPSVGTVTVNTEPSTVNRVRFY